MSTAGQRRSEGESDAESHVSRQRVYRNESEAEHEGTEDTPESDRSIFRMQDGGATAVHRSGTAATERGSGEGTESPGGRINFSPGPDVSRLSDRYGMDFVRGGQPEKVRRAESDFGVHRVQQWADEGMTIETMGKPRDMQAFRQRQDSRPEAIPSDIERRNQASLQRSTIAQHETGRAGDGGAPDAVRRVVSSPGTSLDEPVQREMESKMGEDFSDVRVHTGPQAAAAAESIDARAFTVGRHVAFNDGEYQPETDSGKEVLAHELTHVRQQNDGAVSLLPKAEADHPGALTVGDMHVQPKLEVSSPDDPAEKEAERVAEQVMKMDDPSPETGDGPAVQKSPEDGQRAEASADDDSVDPTADLCPRCARRYAAGKPLNCTECEEKVQAKCSDCEKKKKKLQRSATASEGGEVEGGPEQKIEAVRSSSGESLPDSARSYFEPRFGQDFSDVSVHTGSAADEAARSINAEAFTVGSDMAFRSGAYEPQSSSGKELIAHELTHVVQQTDGASTARTNPAGTTPVSRRPAIVQRFGMPSVMPDIGDITQEVALAVLEKINDEVGEREFSETPTGWYLPLHYSALYKPDDVSELFGSYSQMAGDAIVEYVPEDPAELASMVEGELAEILPDIVPVDSLPTETLIEQITDNPQEWADDISQDVIDELQSGLDSVPDVTEMDENSSSYYLKLWAANRAVAIFSEYEGPFVRKQDLVGKSRAELINQTVEEEYPGWKGSLDACPETVSGENPPGNGEPEGKFIDKTGPWTGSMHPGASYDYRAGDFSSVGDTKHGQQCCYGVPDCLAENGEEKYYLITPENLGHFSSAEIGTPGTPDVWSPIEEMEKHNLVDVPPATQKSAGWYMNATWAPRPGIHPTPSCDSSNEGDSSGGSGGGGDNDTGGGGGGGSGGGSGGGGEKEPEQDEWVVKEGDTLWEIAREVYGEPYQWEQIADENGIKDERNLQIGTVLKIPPIR